MMWEINSSVTNRVGKVWNQIEAIILHPELWNRRVVLVLFILGLILRLAGGFFYGTQDMEWWKAFGNYGVRAGNVTSIYGAKDHVILDAYEKGLSYAQVLAETQTIIDYTPHNYFRTQYFYPQPPLYIYSIWICTKGLELFNKTLSNGRLFNWFLNLEPVLASIFITLIIFVFAKSLFDHDSALSAALLYWLNPLVVLNSPIQGYRDPLCALFAVTSIFFLCKKSLAGAFIFLVLAALYKPQGILIAPIVIWVGLKKHPIRENLRAWGASALTVVLVFSPFIIDNRVLSAILGISSINSVSQDVSRGALNFWWPVQYIYNIVTGVYVFQDVPAAILSKIVGFNIRVVGYLLLAIFTFINLWKLTCQNYFGRQAIVVASALQVYAYFILRVGVQTNHYFILIPLLACLACSYKQYFRYYLMVSSIFFLQDIIFYGLGRDFNYFGRLLVWLSMGWTTIFLAFANVALFSYICYRTFSQKTNDLQWTFMD